MGNHQKVNPLYQEEVKSIESFKLDYKNPTGSSFFYYFKLQNHDNRYKENGTRSRKRMVTGNLGCPTNSSNWQCCTQSIPAS